CPFIDISFSEIGRTGRWRSGNTAAAARYSVSEAGVRRRACGESVIILIVEAKAEQGSFMLIKKPEAIKAREITDKDVYTSRRLFLRGGALAATALGTGWLYRH